MFQQITLGADFIETWTEDRNLLLKTLPYLDQEETIFVDKSKFYKRIYSFIDKLPDIDKPLVNGIVNTWLYGNIKPVIPDSFPVTPGEVPDEDFRRLLSIANGNGDRILVKYHYDSEYQLTIALKTNVHVCSLYKYLTPGKTEHIANPRRVEFDDREEFDPKPILEPYLKISRRLWIQDAWPLMYSKIETSYKPRPFLCDLFRMCNKRSSITIHTLSDEERDDSDPITQDLVKTELKKICPLGIHLKTTFGNVHDRPWKTDQFYIDVGGGIGMFFKNFGRNVYENGAGENAYITITAREVK